MSTESQQQIEQQIALEAAEDCYNSMVEPRYGRSHWTRKAHIEAASEIILSAMRKQARAQAQEHFKDRKPKISGKFLLSTQPQRSERGFDPALMPFPDRFEQRSEQPSWTRYEFIRDNDPSHGASYDMRATPDGRFVTYDDANAALTAERKRGTDEERQRWQNVHADFIRAVEARERWKQTALSALAAIEKHNKEYRLPSSTEECIKVDLSLLHEYVRKEQKPLVDALELLEYDENGHITAWPSQKAWADALAKVKQ